MSDEPLAYHSAEPDALQADEVVLWDGVPPAPGPDWVRIVVVTIIVLASIAWFVTIMQLAQPLKWGWLGSSIACAVAFGVAMVGRHERSLATHRRYRFTNRRLIVADPRPGSSQIVDVIDLSSVVMHTDRKGASISATGAVIAEFDGVDEADRVHSIMLGLPQLNQRRQRIRRTRRVAPTDQTCDGAARMHDTATELTLQPGETLLWTGRPRAWDLIGPEWWAARLTTAAWTLIPVALLLGCFFWLRANPDQGFFWFIGVSAFLWMVGALHSLFIAPFKAARRRRRTTYYLTSVRVIVVERRGGKSVLNSHFLDMANGVSVTLEDDGSGTISIALPHVQIENIENAADTHRLLVEAIRGTGGPLLNPRGPAEDG